MTCPDAVGAPELREQRVCPFCREPTPRASYIHKNSYHVLKCLECGLVYTDYEPTQGELESLFGEGDFQGDNAIGYLDVALCARQDRINFQRRLRKLAPYVNKGRLLDLGCGPGTIYEMAGREWEVWGVDISCYAMDQAKERGHRNLYCGDVLNMDLPEDSFDLILSWGFLELLSDPGSLLDKANRLLRKGGVLNIVTGDVGSSFARMCGKYWHIYNLPEILEFFSVATISKFLERSGFVVERAVHETNFYSLDYLIERLTRSLGMPIWRKKRPSGLIGFLNRIVVPVNFLDGLYIVARKK